ncbi:hypothetical protein SynA1825c_01606 [Synechococcus sp. A18-25c]|nr:hypothetical protein SynA1560_01618 [Synechococcus sp. A15-60]QNJ19910.1 hypothetical protein SynA1825c_01606 [Synechococcus sp. A18-25c]
MPFKATNTRMGPSLDESQSVTICWQIKLHRRNNPLQSSVGGV